MGNFILISGSNNSGKSIFAESVLDKISDSGIYVATMIAHTEDNLLRIKKHKNQREKYNFTTVESPYTVRDCITEIEGAVLLEDISNLLANNIFDKHKDVDSVFEDVCILKNKCKVLVAVTISGLKSDGYDYETANYINSLNILNQKLADCADMVYEMKNNVPVLVKGETNDFI